MKVFFNLVPVVYNISSAHKLLEYAKLVYGFGFKNLVVIKAVGSALQSGIPEAFKLAIKYEASIVVLNDLNDFLELLKPCSIYFLTVGEELTSIQEIINKIENCKVAVVVNGLDIPFTPKELEFGKEIHVVERNIGNIGSLAIILWTIYKEFIKA